MRVMMPVMLAGEFPRRARIIIFDPSFLSLFIILKRNTRRASGLCGHWSYSSHPPQVQKKDTAELRDELERMLTVKQKHWDTARISGTPQRYLTEFLKVRMAEQLADQEASIVENKDRYNELVVQARQRERMLRQVMVHRKRSHAER